MAAFFYGSLFFSALPDAAMEDCARSRMIQDGSAWESWEKEATGDALQHPCELPWHLQALRHILWKPLRERHDLCCWPSAFHFLPCTEKNGQNDQVKLYSSHFPQYMHFFCSKPYSMLACCSEGLNRKSGL